MESRNRENKSMAHKLETPQPMIEALVSAAEAIGTSRPDDYYENVACFKDEVFKLMGRFNLDFDDFRDFMDKKREEKGGFTRGAIQAHPYKGLNGARLVRDKLSAEFFDIADKKLYRSLLERKLVEETFELVEAMNRRERIEELSDVFEVFNTMLNVAGINDRKLEEYRRVGKKSRRQLASKFK